MTVTIAGTTGITQPTDTCTTSLVLTGSGSGTTTMQAAATASGTITVPAGTGTIAVNGVSSNLVSGTATASTSGTSISFTGLPSWVKRITFMLNGVSSSGTSVYQIQLGYGAGPTYQTASYTGGSYNSGAGTYNTNFTGIAIVAGMLSTSVWSGGSTISLLDSATNTWEAHGVCGDATGAAGFGAVFHGWSVPLSGTLTAIRLTTVNGTDTFDAGKVNILYE